MNHSIYIRYPNINKEHLVSFCESETVFIFRGIFVVATFVESITNLNQMYNSQDSVEGALFPLNE